jgi:pimeloyl-ACP methyl ester carboxylesterase
VLDDYLRDAFADEPEGGVSLKCPPAIEACMFEMGGNEALFAGDPIRVPTLVQRALGGWFSAEEYAQFRPVFPHADLEEIDAGHMVPMDAPDVVAARVLRFWDERVAHAGDRA